MKEKVESNSSLFKVQMWSESLNYMLPGAHNEKEHPTTETALVYTVFVLDHTWMGESLLQLITPMYNFVHEPAVAFCVQCALR